MKKMFLVFGLSLALLVVIGLVGTRPAIAQNPLAMGTILQRTDLVDAKGMEAILVLREVPPGKESGRHTQMGNEIVYILEGSVTLEIDGKPAVTLKAGEAFQTMKGQVHNVKNASTTEPAKALAFYIAKKGSKLEELSTPAQ